MRLKEEDPSDNWLEGHQREEKMSEGEAVSKVTEETTDEDGTGLENGFDEEKWGPEFKYCPLYQNNQRRGAIQATVGNHS